MGFHMYFTGTQYRSLKYIKPTGDSAKRDPPQEAKFRSLKTLEIYVGLQIYCKKRDPLQGKCVPSSVKCNWELIQLYKRDPHQGIVFLRQSRDSACVRKFSSLLSYSVRLRTLCLPLNPLRNRAECYNENPGDYSSCASGRPAAVAAILPQICSWRESRAES
jgi:hypothetical protein